MVGLMREWRSIDLVGVWKCCFGIGLMLSAIIFAIVMSALCTVFCMWVVTQAFASVLDIPSPPVNYDPSKFTNMLLTFLEFEEPHADSITTASSVSPEIATVSLTTEGAAQQREMEARDALLRARKAKYAGTRHFSSSSTSSSSRRSLGSRFVPYPDTSRLAECQKEFCAGRPGRKCCNIALWSYGSSGPIFCRACAQG